MDGQERQEQGGVLPKLMEQTKRPCLFWLDAHYSMGQTAKGSLETPILLEVRCILRHGCADAIVDRHE